MEVKYKVLKITIIKIINNKYIINKNNTPIKILRKLQWNNSLKLKVNLKYQNLYDK